MLFQCVAFRFSGPPPLLVPDQVHKMFVCVFYVLFLFLFCRICDDVRAVNRSGGISDSVCCSASVRLRGITCECSDLVGCCSSALVVGRGVYVLHIFHGACVHLFIYQLKCILDPRASPVVCARSTPRSEDTTGWHTTDCALFCCSCCRQNQGFRCSNLHGDLLGEERDACMEAFRHGLNKVRYRG